MAAESLPPRKGGPSLPAGEEGGGRKHAKGASEEEEEEPSHQEEVAGRRIIWSFTALDFLLALISSFLSFLLFGEKYFSFSTSISDGSFNETNYNAKLFNAKDPRMGFIKLFCTYVGRYVSKLARVNRNQTPLCTRVCFWIFQAGLVEKKSRWGKQCVMHGGGGGQGKHV